MRIAKDIHKATVNTLTLPPHHTTNSYIIGGGRDAVLIDPIFKRAGALSSCLGDNNIQGIQLAAVTHPHPDHYGGLDRLLKKFGGKVLCHSGAVHAGAFGVSGERSLLGFQGGETIHAGPYSVEVLHMPGHSPFHLCFYIKDEGILFSGDVVLGHGTSMISPPEGNMADYMQSLHRLAAMDIRVICPAHGPVVTQGAAEWIQWYIRHRQMRETRVLAAIQEGLTTVRSITRRIYDDADYQMHGFGLLPRAQRSVLAHLEKLEKDGVVVQRMNAREPHYFIV